MEPGDYLLRLGEHSRKTTAAATISLDGEAVVRKVSDILAADQPLEELHAPQRTAEAPQGILLTLRGADCATVDNVSRIPKTVTTYVPEGAVYFPAVNDNPYRSPNYCPEEIRGVRNCPSSTLYDVKSGKVTMEEFAASVNEFLAFRRYDILRDKGKISGKMAKEKAAAEYAEFNKTQKITSDFDKAVKRMLKAGDQE